MGSAIISSELWDETRDITTAVTTFRLRHQAQVPGTHLGNSHLNTLILVGPLPPPNICSLDNRSLNMFKKNPLAQAIPMSSRGGGGKERVSHIMPGASSKPRSCAPPTARSCRQRVSLGDIASLAFQIEKPPWTPEINLVGYVVFYVAGFSSLVCVGFRVYACEWDLQLSLPLSLWFCDQTNPNRIE